SASISPRDAVTTAPHRQAGDRRNETTGKHPTRVCNPQTATTRASHSRFHRAGPCESDGSKQSLPLRDVAWSRATQPADRRGCTSECAAHDRSAVQQNDAARTPEPPPRRKSTHPL